jgi:hypothetical protein
MIWFALAICFLLAAIPAWCWSFSRFVTWRHELAVHAMNFRTPVLAVALAAVAFFFVYVCITAPPPTPQQVAAEAARVAARGVAAGEIYDRKKRFDELQAKVTAHDKAMTAELYGLEHADDPGPLTWDECMLFYGSQELCTPRHSSGPDPVPVYIVPRP